MKAPGGIPIRARNLEQQFLIDALLDDSIHMLTCFGKAGTGKTLLRVWSRGVTSLLAVDEANGQIAQPKATRGVFGR